MNDTVREKLKEIVSYRQTILSRYGSDPVLDSHLCEKLLTQICGSFPREVGALVTVVEEGMTALIQSMPDNPAVGLAPLVDRLVETHAFTPDTASWALESWVLALGSPARVVNITSRSDTPAKQPLQTDVGVTVHELQSDLDSIEDEIFDAEEEAGRFTGGLITSLLAVRIQILSVSRDLLRQRILAMKAGAEVLLQTKGTQPDAARAHALAVEIQRVKTELENARRESENFGGLVLAMKETAIATQEQTLSLLRQQYLTAKYGLWLPSIRQQAPPDVDSLEPVPLQPAAATTLPSQQPKRVLEILSIDSRVTESNDTWWKYAWKLKVRNLSQQHLYLNATIEFLDSDGFVINDASDYNLPLPPLDEQVYTGYTHINADIAMNVSSLNAKVSVR